MAIHKKLTAMLICISIAVAVRAQTTDTVNYSFTHYRTKYEPLTNATSLNKGKVWLSHSYAIDLPFHFNIMGETLDSICLPQSGDKGNLTGSIINEDCPETKFNIKIATHYRAVDRGYLENKSISEIRYKIDNSIGGRIFKIEWHNAGFLNELINYNTTNWYYHLQIWLYEHSNSIEFHFGKTFVEDRATITGSSDQGWTSFRIAKCKTLKNSDSTILREGQSYSLDGSPFNPSVIKNGSSNLDSIPPEGMVYRYTPQKTTAIAKLKPDTGLNLYPNPVQNKLLIEQINSNLPIQLYDNKGVLIAIWQSNTEEKDLSQLSPGMYFIAQGKKRAKFIKE